MFIEARTEIDLPTHKIKKGGLVDLPKDVALRLVKDGKAVEVGRQDAIKRMSGVETRETTSVSDANVSGGHDRRKKTSRKSR